MMGGRKSDIVPANSTARQEIRAYGIRGLLSPHPRVRQLKRHHQPSLHGNKLWDSSWLLMDFFKKKGMRKGSHVMELGCGWGLAAVYCAKKHGAVVTGVDTDSHVFPYLELHARINGVIVETMKKDMNSLTKAHLRGYDILIGADICFWDKMGYSLKNLIHRALKGGVQAVVIADPGRPPFLNLAEHYVQRELGDLLDWEVHQPKSIAGRILQVGTLES
jgi:predicted nicotinamide N-methyase